MNFIQRTLLLLLCAFAIGSAYGTEVNDPCKANNDALDALLVRAPARSYDAAVEVEELFELNQPQRVKVAKTVPWTAAEVLIRRGLVRSIEQPTKGRQFIFFGISGTKYSSTFPPSAHPYAVARQVDPCGRLISLMTVD
jgi:hypothetical protein